MPDFAMHCKSFLLPVLSLLGAVLLRAAEAPPATTPLALAEKVLAQGLAVSDLGIYPGTLLLQGMSELALVSPDKSMLARTIALYQKFPTKEIKGRGSFISYEVGGSGAALLRYHGVADVLASQVSDGARRMVAQQKRSSEGLLMPPWSVTEKDQIFIDPAFAVTPFLLYAGLAMTSRGIRVIEFNARFGDPETQVVLANLRTPLGQLLMAAATRRLGDLPPLVWQSGYAVTVVIAAAGYPEAPRTGDVISGLEEAAELVGVEVFHAGTSVSDDGSVVSSGGRVLSVTAHGATLASAREHAYAAVDLITLEGSHHRRDIAQRAADAVEG